MVEAVTRPIEFELRLNPRLPAELRGRVEAAVETPVAKLLTEPLAEPLRRRFADHVGVLTSGSTRAGRAQLILLSWQALRASAQAVNQHLGATGADRWYKVLPDFHVGGLGIDVRASLSGSEVVASAAADWQPILAYRELAEKGCTLTALVPTQLHDWVSMELCAPSALRAAIIGGAALGKDLARRALALGWPILPSYGLTECASQVATASLGWWESAVSGGLSGKGGTGGFVGLAEPPTDLPLLPHIEARIEGGLLALKSPALLSAQVEIGFDGSVRVSDPKADGWLVTNDRAWLRDRRLQPLGREQDFVKVGGEGVDLASSALYLQEILVGLKKAEAGREHVKALAPVEVFSSPCTASELAEISAGLDMELLAVPDSRLGSVIHAVYAGGASALAEQVVAEFNLRQAPFARIRELHYLAQVPRTALGKFDRFSALRAIGFEPQTDLLGN